MFNQDDLYNLACSDEFRAYRKEEIREAAKVAKELLLGGDPLEAKGAMRAILHILKIPLLLAKGEKERIERFQRITKEDQAEFELSWMREMLKDE
jgi:hypothetical protein